ncbi:hypothetical protein E2978_03590 (plasmid) [Paracoccus yeei]
MDSGRWRARGGRRGARRPDRGVRAGGSRARRRRRTVRDNPRAPDRRGARHGHDRLTDPVEGRAALCAVRDLRRPAARRWRSTSAPCRWPARSGLRRWPSPSTCRARRLVPKGINPLR